MEIKTAEEIHFMIGEESDYTEKEGFIRPSSKWVRVDDEINWLQDLLTNRPYKTRQTLYKMLNNHLIELSNSKDNKVNL